MNNHRKKQEALRTSIRSPIMRIAAAASRFETNERLDAAPWWGVKGGMDK